MRVSVTDHNTDQVKLFEGSPDHVQSLLLFQYPFLRRQGEYKLNLNEMLEVLDSTAYFAVEVEHDPTSDDDLIENEMGDYTGSEGVDG